MYVGLDFSKTSSKKVVHKVGGFIESKIAEAISLSNNGNIVEKEPVKEIIISPEERDEVLNNLRQVFLWKWSIKNYLSY